MFGKVKGMLKMSEASVIVKQALRALPLPPPDPDALATRLVAISYNSKPELFDGKLGKPPRPITTAAVSLAGGLTLEECDANARQCVFLALGSVLLDAGTNAHRYGLSPIDHRLLQLCEAAYLKHEEMTRDATSAIVGGLGL